MYGITSIIMPSLQVQYIIPINMQYLRIEYQSYKFIVFTCTAIYQSDEYAVFTCTRSLRYLRSVTCTVSFQWLCSL